MLYATLNILRKDGMVMSTKTRQYAKLKRQPHNTNTKKCNHPKISQTKTAFWMLIMIVFSAIFIVLNYSNMIAQYKTNHANTINDYYEEKFNLLWAYLNCCMIKGAEDNIRPATDSIQQEISLLDMDKLKEDLDSGIYPDELVSIFKNNLENITLNELNNGKNGTMVVSNNFIIMNNSYYLYPSDADSTHSFSKIITSGYNKALAEDAINRLYQQNGSLICIEYAHSDNPAHIQITAPTKSQFHDVYMKEGLDGFKNYQFLVPIYITEKGDIFGQNDIVNGERVDTNHKFIVIQEFNLYDQLSEKYSDQFDDSYIVNLTRSYESTLLNLYLLGLIFIGFIILVILEFITVYNNFIYGYVIAQHTNIKPNNIESPEK